MTLVIPGYTSDDKVPGVVAVNQWGAGKRSIGAIPLLCVLFGNMGSSGTAVENTRYDVTTPEEADALFEPRSELARMAHAALDTPGVTLRCVGISDVAGGEAATFTFTIGGSWTTAGELGLQLDEEVLRIAIGASDTATTAGDAVADKVDQAQDGRLFCTAVNTTGQLVLTVFSVGARGNQHVAWLDTSLMPSGMTITPKQLSDVSKSGAGPVIAVSGKDTADHTYVITITTGGTNSGTAQYTLTVDGGTPSSPAAVPSVATALPGHTGITFTPAVGTYVLNETYTFSGVAPLSNAGIPFMGGTGTDDIEDALDATESLTNDYIAAAQNDVTNVGKIETAVNTKAAFDVGRLEQYIACRNRGLTDGIALGQAGMNDQLGTCVWPQNHPEHPSRTAARLAALFSITDGAQPNTNYDGLELYGAAPHKLDSDIPNRATLKSALNNGITPLITVDGKLVIVRAICSRSLSGSTPDYRTYDHGDVAVPIRVRKELIALGESVKSANPYDGPDPAEGLPPLGTMTPKVWDGRVNALLQEWETERFNWLQDVATNPSQSVYDPDAKRIMSLVPTVVKHQFHQLGIIVNQTAA